MAVREILQCGDPRLTRMAEPIVDFDTDWLHLLVTDMLDTLRAANGAGLVAPQIGVNLQLIVFGRNTPNPRYPDRPLVPPTVLLNPTIVALGNQQEYDWEGCLSIPGKRGWVPRWRQIRYLGFDPFGIPIDRTVEGFHARVVQHECDHLTGKLYPNRMDDNAKWTDVTSEVTNSD